MCAPPANDCKRAAYIRTMKFTSRSFLYICVLLNQNRLLSFTRNLRTALVNGLAPPQESSSAQTAVVSTREQPPVLSLRRRVDAPCRSLNGTTEESMENFRKR